MLDSISFTCPFITIYYCFRVIYYHLLYCHLLPFITVSESFITIYYIAIYYHLFQTTLIVINGYLLLLIT